MGIYQDEVISNLNKKNAKLIEALPTWCKPFFNDLEFNNKSPRTIEQYAIDITNFVEWLKTSDGFKNKDLNKLCASDVLDVLTDEDIQNYFSVAFKNKKTRKSSSESYRARKASSLRSFYSFFYKKRYINNSLAELIPVPKVHDKEILALDGDMVQRMISAVDDTSDMNEHQYAKWLKTNKRDKLILLLFFQSGMRVSELVGIDLEDIEIFKYLKENEKTCGTIVVTRKGGNEAQIPFGDEVKEVLLDYINNERNRLFIETKKGVDKGYINNPDEEPALLISMQRKRLSVRSVEQIIKNYSRKADINIKCTPHTLRRTFATNLYQRSHDIYLTASALGHSSVETTKKHYAKESKTKFEDILTNTDNLMKNS